MSDCCRCEKHFQSLHWIHVWWLDWNMKSFFLYKISDSEEIYLGIRWKFDLLPKLISFIVPFSKCCSCIFRVDVLVVFNQLRQHLKPIRIGFEFRIVERVNFVLPKKIPFHFTSDHKKSNLLTSNSLIIAPVRHPCSRVASARSEYGWSPK